MPEDVPRPVVLDDRYRLGERLGRGGMADVYRAEDLLRGDDVAVKVFRPEVADAVDPNRIARETRFLAGARHPALVSVLGASGPESTSPYLVMELVEGADLAHRIDAGAIDAEHARRIGVDVAGALALLHSRKLVHRDVKPANILVPDAAAEAATGTAAKLADLGIAVGLDETRITASNAILGTAAYLSPEQVQGRAVGPASDVYALGLVLIESLTGQRAFDGGLIESAMARLNRPPTLPPDASPELASLLARMTALDPAARPTAADVAEVLTALRGGMTAPDFPETAPLARAAVSAQAVTAEIAAVSAHVTRRRTRRRAVPIAAVAAAGVVLVSGMTLLPQLRAGQVDSIAAPTAAAAPSTPAASASAVSSSGASAVSRTTGSVAISGVALVSHTSSVSQPANRSVGASQPTHRTHAAAHAKRSPKHAPKKAPQKAKSAAKKAPHAAHKAPAPHQAKGGSKAHHG